ncbi:hypothetical protein CHGG_08874 [Chaetomium globosum CBS 148.51]|uniref:Uncharacterized protein n=1 Tax=Chaetomium globosum (strain ATCC 6205 / CBS 148.51 / DSM 1962 / NBRC 6347 / NRRL 1970) TaxID=306901 RepID=Q2GT30_CHAGB|nr:uncharacterized protein CHGG_08874 [Chaetomium globosum CBS 148.51]EAQ84860.1 hypothetical protein CHGG_08874 [Chaetomium globosum CBS 148.51]
MEPYAHTADEMDDMVNKLGRLNSRDSSSSRHTSSMASSIDDRYDGRRRVPSGGMPVPRTPDSPRYLGQDDVYRMPTYELGQRPANSVSMQPPGTPRAPQFHRKDSYASERRPSKGSSAGYSLYPAAPKPPIAKPLPPLPVLNRQGSHRASSQPSLDGSDLGSGDTSRYSQSSRGSTLERVSSSGSAASPPAALGPSPVMPSGEYRARPQLMQPVQPVQPMQQQHGSSPVHLVPWKQLVAVKDKHLKEPTVYFFDISTSSATLASKHGNNIIRIWSVGSGEVQNNLKISCYTNAQPRSREYFVRSHAILSETSNLIAIATGFGDTLEIWDWSKKKRLQTIDNANRWAAAPAPPGPDHPPPERETLLTAWEIHDGAPTSNTPYKVVAPWQHAELDTALPSGLATYGSVAVSIWIPASYRAVPIPGRGGFNLAPAAVHHRHVLVWDFSASSTKTFRIPNATSCVSPDCRFVAYCDARGVESGARGCLALVDAMTGRQLWCWPDPGSGDCWIPRRMLACGPALGDLSLVTEMCFSADGGFLFVGDAEGGIGVFEVREGAPGSSGGEVGLRALR